MTRVKESMQRMVGDERLSSHCKEFGGWPGSCPMLVSGKFRV